MTQGILERASTENAVPVAEPALSVCVSSDLESRPENLPAVALNRLRAKEFSDLMQKVLREIDYDHLNSLIRWDYSSAPLPNASRSWIHSDIQTLEGKHLSPREAAGIKFFLLGEPLEFDDAQKIFGRHAGSIIDAGLTLGVFRRTETGTLGLNGLALVSHKLSGGKVVYAFCDEPPWSEHALDRQRVYSGTDSYFMNAKLQTLRDIDGVVAEMGSGSGIQLITALLLNDKVELALGIETEARARNVSLLNAHLNGVADRFAVGTHAGDLNNLLNGREIRLAISNPPFIAAPAHVNVAPGTAEEISIDLSMLFPAAGWGGEDGLIHTRKFVAALLPYMAENSQILIYSQFAKGADSLLAADEFRHEYPGEGVSFEKFPLNASYTNISSAQWSRYVGRALAAEHPNLSDRVIDATRRATRKMLREHDIEGFDSGILAITMGDGGISSTGFADKEEDLKLIFANEGHPSLFVGLTYHLTKDDLKQMDGVGGRNYLVPASWKRRKEELDPKRLDTVLISRKLSCVEGDAGLEVGMLGKEYQFQVRHKGRVIESGAVLDAESGAVSDKYKAMVACIRTEDPLKILRSWRIQQVRGGIEPGVVNGIFGLSLRDCALVEVIPVTNTFRISEIRYFPGYHSDKGGSSEFIERYRGSLLSPEYLRLSTAMREKFPDWK